VHSVCLGSSNRPILRRGEKNTFREGGEPAHPLSDLVGSLGCAEARGTHTRPVVASEHSSDEEYPGLLAERDFFGRRSRD